MNNSILYKETQGGERGKQKPEWAERGKDKKDGGRGRRKERARALIYLRRVRCGGER